MGHESDKRMPRLAAVRAALFAFTAVAGCTPEQASAPADTSEWQRFLAQGHDTTEATTSALVGTAPKRTRTIAALMFNIAKLSDGTADPAGIPNASNITSIITGTGQSQRHMYQEASFGIQDLQADILGPYELPVANCLTIACCGPSSDKTGNGDTVASIIAGLPKKYDHYFWVYGKIPSGADCGTWGDEGAPNKPAVYSSYSFHQLVGYAQEIGHNFGMTHEPTMTCTGMATFLDDSTQCTHVEYGSTLSYMGSGSHHPSAYHKYAQGWIGGCNVVQATGSGTFTLVPQELPCDGVQLLQVPAPKIRPAPAKGDRQGNGPMLSNYYLEMRGPYGFDSNLKPQVTISIGAGLPTTTTFAPYNYLLDMTPEARADLTNAGLMTVGQTYMDPGGGLTITLMAIDANSATVSITSSGTAGATCVDATAFTAPGPGGDSCGPLATGSTDGGVSTPDGGATDGPAAGGRSGSGGSGQMTGGTGGVSGGAGRAGTGSGGRGGAGMTASGSGGRAGTGGASSGSGGSDAGVSGTGGAPATGSGGNRSGGNGSGATTSQGSGGGTATGGTGGGSGANHNDAGQPSETGGASGCSCSTTGQADLAGFGWTFLLVGLAVVHRRKHARR